MFKGVNTKIRKANEIDGLHGRDQNSIVDSSHYNLESELLCCHPDDI